MPHAVFIVSALFMALTVALTFFTERKTAPKHETSDEREADALLSSNASR
jgi:preprotein translocase subunit SecG